QPGAPPQSPALSSSTGALGFSGTAGGSDPAAQSVTISNTGGGTLNWTASKTQPWLTLSAPSGIAPAHLSVATLIAGLTAGTYTSTSSPNTRGSRALKRAGTGRGAATWYSSTVFRFDLNLTDGNAHQVPLCATDYASSNRGQRVEVLDYVTGTVLDSRTMNG